MSAEKAWVQLKDSLKRNGFNSIQWLSCLTLCDPMDSSTPRLPVHHQLPEFTQTHVHWVGDAIQPSHSLSMPFSFCLQSYPASGSFLRSQFFASGGQSIGVSASASVFPMNIQGWFKIGKGLWQCCVLSCCLFNLHAEYIIQNVVLDESQLESRWLEEITITSDMQITHPNGRKQKWTKEPFDEGERGKQKELA